MPVSNCYDHVYFLFSHQKVFSGSKKNNKYMKESSSESVLQKPIEKLNLLQLAFGDGTTKKAFFSALVVGSILTSINHGDMILSGEYPSWLKVLLTYFVPYCVTTWGAITGKLTRQRKMK